MQIKPVREFSVGSPMGQGRSVPLRIGSDKPNALLVTCSADKTVDPYSEMFFFPTDTLKFVVFDLEGKEMWRKELGKGVIPGEWFVPVFPFDMDGDGTDEIYFVNNIDDDHPLGHGGKRLERLDAQTGETTGQWQWPNINGWASMSHAHRNFIVGGYANGEPVLVTAQGTYGVMAWQGWNADMSHRWERKVEGHEPGARGSHMCPVVDINNDNTEELLWGERCIELNAGTELFCADRDVYRGHSDIIQPVLDYETGRWFLYTCRETPNYSPRVVCFDDAGNRVWSDLEDGHMDLGWVARLGDNHQRIASAIRVGHKTAGSKGLFHDGHEQFCYDVLTGAKVDPGYSVYKSVPVDMTGDGYHEIVRGQETDKGEIVDRKGNVLANIGGIASVCNKFMDLPGEQVLSYHSDGTLRIWADIEAEDSDEALKRYAHPYYELSQRLTAVGSNLNNLGGL